MNPSYGDEAPRGRAHMSGPGYGGGYEPPTPPSSGRASAGSREPGAGRASVGGPGAGRASVGGPGAGRASVGVPGAGRASVGGPGAGRASVGAAGAGGTYGAAGRASVRPDSYADYGGGGDGPRRPGLGGLTDRLSGGNKSKRRNIIIAAIAALVMIGGMTVVGGTYFFDGVKLPEQMGNLSQASVIYFSDGKTEMARLGQNRQLVKFKQIPAPVWQAVISAEDRTFLVNNGVDFKGIARAAVNNFTGGSRQGASTITQQYARNVATLSGITYSRKLREAVIAMKISQRYTKQKIMEMYLNTVYFGRGATGIQAAAHAYFGKDVWKLTASEGMVLAALIKQPEKDDSPGGYPGYDPANNLQGSQERWGYVREGMVTLKFMTAEQAAALKYPTPKDGWKVKASNPGEFGLEKGNPNGNVVQQVRAELAKHGIKDLRNPGGLKIYTTISYTAQKYAVAAANQDAKSSPMHIQPKKLQAALVAIDTHGRVVAYYGGNDPTGTDFATINTSADGKSWGGQQPGSSFKAYVLAAALDAGISVKSVWDGANPRKFDDRQNPVVNAEADCKSPCPVTLEKATVDSLNTVYYAVAKKLGKQKVLEMAAKAGVHNLWDSDGNLHDITTPEGRAAFDTDVGIGKFRTTVLDNAAGYSAFAAGGYASPPHFVTKVINSDGNTIYGEQVNPQAIFKNKAVIGDLDHTLEQVLQHGGLHDDGRHHENTLDDGRPAAGKTGTWDYLDRRGENLQAWQAGYTPDLAAVVWVGNEAKEGAITWNMKGRSDPQPVYGSGLPAEVWLQFMNDYLRGKPIQQLRTDFHLGDPNLGEIPVAQQQQPLPGQGPGQQQGQQCTIPILCPPSGGGGGGTGGGTGRN